MQEIITVYDFVLLPLYLFIFYLIVRKKSKKYAAIGLKKYFIIAFWLRMAGAIGYGLLIQYYYGYGDTIGYYNGGNVISGMIAKDLSALKYLFMPADDIVSAAKLMGFADEIPESMPNDSNVFIMKLAAILSIFTFNKYLIIAITFGFFSFIGVWKLFFVFYQMNDRKQVKLLAFFVLFLPSLWFWGSGLIKEPICVGLLGIIFYLFHKNFIQHNFHKRDIVVMLVLLFFLTIIKSYITVILLISFVVIVFYKLIIKIKHLLLRIITVLMLIIIFTIGLFSFDATFYIDYFIDNSFKQVQQLQQSYQIIHEMEDVSNKGAFLVTTEELSSESIILNSPGVIGTCLFRPFVWEAKKLIIFFASLEALLTLLITVFVFFKAKILGFFLITFGNPLLIFCFVFSILFALVVGYTTFNFGTMIRYKIIFLPFYYYLLISVYTHYKTKKIS